MRTLILANGNRPSKKLLENLRARCSYFVAADGGGNCATELGFRPDIVLGDLDSFRYADSYDGRILRDEDQETNDLEKALHHVLQQKAVRVDVLGATGRRLDHTLKNLSVMQQFHTRFDQLVFYDDVFYTRILPQDYTLSLPASHTVSLFPLSGKVTGITTEGLKYPLDNESLVNGRRDGSSNETISGTIRIRHRSGSLLLMTGLTDKLLD